MAASSDHILHAFSPRIVVFADEHVERSCQQNGCKGLDDLFKPWQFAIEKVPVLSSTLSVTTHSSFSVRFTSHSKLLQSQVGGGGTIPYSAEIVADIISNLIHSVRYGEGDVAPYEVLRDVLLAVTPADSQSPFDQTVCQLFAISSSDVSPLDTIGRLTDSSRQSPAFSANPYAKSCFNNSLCYYLLVHDVSLEGPDLERAYQILSQVAQKYGPHCSLLVINSSSQHNFRQSETNSSAVERDCNPPFHAQYAAALKQLRTVDPFTRLTDVLADTVLVGHSEIGLVLRNPKNETPSFRYARHLQKEDINNIRNCIRELTVQSIIPWMEARLREWTEVFLQSKKGIAGRLFGASKKFFGGPGPAPANPLKTDADSSYSGTHCTTRRSADFAFMLRDYKSAMSLYEAIRQDYLQEGNMVMIPDVVVMYGLSCLLGLPSLNAERTATLRSQYIEIISLVQRSAEDGLLQSSRQLDLLRNLISFVEIFALQQRKTDTQAHIAVSDLLVILARRVVKEFRVMCAILLQQAALFDISGARSHIRKRAFHLTQAAWHYEHTGHHILAGKCSTAALLCLRSRTTLLCAYSQDLLQYTLANQADVSGNHQLAANHYSSLLSRGLGFAYQAGTLAAFCSAKQRVEWESDILSEPCEETSPILPCVAIRVLPPVSTFLRQKHGQSATPAGSPSEGEGVVHNSGGSRRRTELPNECFVVIDDPFQVDVYITNVINAPIELTCLSLSLSNLSGNNVNEAFRVHEIPHLIMLPLERKKISFAVIPTQVVHAKVACLRYRLAGMLYITQDHAPSITITVETPTLSMAYQLPDTSQGILEGESVSLQIYLHNMGEGTVQDISLSVRAMDCNSSHCNIDDAESGVLHPAESRLFDIELRFYGKGKIILEIVVGYLQQGSECHARILRRHPFCVQSSIGSAIHLAPFITEQHSLLYSLGLDLENKSLDQNFLISRLTFACHALEPRKTSRTLKTILRMHQLFRRLDSAPGPFRRDDDSICSKLCSNDCFLTYPVVNLGSSSQLPSEQAVTSYVPAKRRSAKSTMIILPSTDICLPQSDFITELALRSSATEDFEGLPKKITLCRIAGNVSDGAATLHATETQPRSFAIVTKHRNQETNATMRMELPSLAHQQLAYAGAPIMQFPHEIDISSEVRCLCSGSDPAIRHE